MKAKKLAICLALVATVATYTIPVYAIPTKEKFSAVEYQGKRRSADEIVNIQALAKLLYGEARSVASTTERAACVWVVLNRVDDPRWSDDIIEVLSQKYQFGGYKTTFPVEDWAEELAADVYDRWCAERDGEEDVGRVIPSEYYYWRGERSCKHNWFRKEFADYTTETYTFELESPYED